MHRVFVNGTAGFIGYHLAQLLLDDGFEVVEFDGMTDYYDVALRRERHRLLAGHSNFRAVEAIIEDREVLDCAVDGFRPEAIVHLAGQAGVRYSFEAPRSYIDANVVGSFNLIEAARRVGPGHLLLASTSSIYGAKETAPFAETDKADTQLTVYAATKKAMESLAHAYAHLWNLPTTAFRFFIVYGPGGRPDMALFKFVNAILNDRPIDLYNRGDMYRDFIYVSDLVWAVRLLFDVPPQRATSAAEVDDGDSLSLVAPHRTVNIDNRDKVSLARFVETIEQATGIMAQKNLLPMQKGDVPSVGRCRNAAAPDRLSSRYRRSRRRRPVRGLVSGLLWKIARVQGASLPIERLQRRPGLIPGISPARPRNVAQSCYWKYREQN